MMTKDILHLLSASSQTCPTLPLSQEMLMALQSMVMIIFVIAIIVVIIVIILSIKQQQHQQQASSFDKKNVATNRQTLKR